MRQELRDSPAGLRYVNWSTSLASEILLRLADPTVAKQLSGLVKDFRKWWSSSDMLLSKEVADKAAKFVHTLRKRGSREFGVAIDAFLADIERMTGKPASEAIRTIRAKPRPRRSR